MHPRASRWLAIVIVAVAVAGAARTARAQNADAEALFNDAERLEGQGKIPEACDAFEASNRIEPRAGTLIRLGQCREAQGRMVSAWSAYKDALTRVKDPAKKAVADGRIAALEPTLSYLTVSVPDESRVEGLTISRNGKPLDPALWNRAAPVDGGAYTIAGQAPGHEAWTTTVEVANTGDKVSVEVPRFKALGQLVERPDPDVTKPAPIPDEPGDSPSAFTGRRKIALGVAGLGVAAIAGGVVLGMSAKSLSDDAFALCPDPGVPCADSAEAQSLSDKANDRALYANIAYGVGGAAVVGAAVLWLTGGPKAEPSRVGVAPRIGRSSSGILVTVKF